MSFQLGRCTFPWNFSSNISIRLINFDIYSLDRELQRRQARKTFCRVGCSWALHHVHSDSDFDIMFAEEVGASSSRKRAQEAKARRLKLKAQQKKVAGKNGEEPKATCTSTPDASLSSSSTKLSAVEHAEAQRKVRAQHAIQVQACIKLQQWLRGTLCRRKLQAERNQNLSSKLQDLGRLRTMLISQKKSYIPPVHIAQELLSLYVSLRRLDLTEQSIALLLLPGMAQEAKNPVASWNTKRLEVLLSMILEHYFSNGCKEPANTMECLQKILKQEKDMRNIVLQRLRQSMMTVPSNIEELRERCFPELLREKNCGLLNVCLEWMDDETFVTQILTCGLLSWRVSNAWKLPMISGWDPRWFDHEDTRAEQSGSTASQRVLANLLTLSFPRNNAWYSVIASLVQRVPYETYSSQSSVMWVEQGGQRKPIVLQRVILDQCKLLLVDALVRKVIQHDSFDETTLAHKNTEDLKDEQALQGTTAATLAAKEAKDANKQWNTSAFAKRLSHGVNRILRKPEAKVVLPDTSSVAKQLAKGRWNEHGSTNSSSSLHTFLLIAKVYAIVVSRWSGDGSVDIMRNDKAKAAPEQSVKSLLNVLGFSTKLLKIAWSAMQSDLADQVKAIHDVRKDRTPIRIRTFQSNDAACLLYLFLTVFSHVLIVTDDAELHDMGRPLPIHQVRRCIQLLKKVMFRAACTDDASIDGDAFGLSLITAASRTMRDLYDRSSRRPLCVPKFWIVDSLLESDMSKCKRHEEFQALLQTSPVLRVCPYMVPFKRRLKLFERLVSTLRVEIQGENSANPFHNNPLKPGVPIRITRGRLLEDGLATMNSMGTNLRERISVHYYNQAGTKEQGIDAGGLFKEFWTDLCSIAFDPNYALFSITESSTGVGNCLYPNPSSSAAHGDTHTTLYAFLGRILGKALFEGITIRPIFSHFTLSFLRGDYNFLHMLADLSTIEPQLYNNLMFLKTYDGDASDLALTFTVMAEEFGGTREISLLPNGGDVEVTNSNKHLYIGLVAKYYVYDRIREQSEAMTKGLLEVIDRSWIQIFNEPELQVLISGASDGKLDVEDMREHCHYAGGYSSIDPSVRRFWNVVASLNEKHQSALLRFITSCERPPPLGFKTLNPTLTIQRVGIFRDGDRLPTASTCFNILKLPTYSSEKVMRERLIYAIESGAGFELS